MPDLNLVAAGILIWVAAISVAFCVYLPSIRTGREAFWARRLARRSIEVEEGFDRSAKPLGPAAYRDSAVARAPATAVPPAATPQAPALAEAGPEAPKANIDEPQAVELQPSADDTGPETVHTPDQFSVLIVDDNAINRQVLEMILDSVGMAHVSVENGLQAVEAMRDTAYDAVLMDLQMPVMDGFEATRRIRDMEARRGASHSTIIVVSANCLDEHIAAGREAGADAHLPKPISAGALIGELASCPTLNRMAA
ncbi:MAG: response regulator [Proteobacteria bacterium]|nr:response regulator [Pseudomonadota bacterium]